MCHGIDIEEVEIRTLESIRKDPYGDNAIFARRINEWADYLSESSKPYENNEYEEEDDDEVS